MDTNPHRKNSWKYSYGLLVVSRASLCEVAMAHTKSAGMNVSLKLRRLGYIHSMPPKKATLYFLFKSEITWTDKEGMVFIRVIKRKGSIVDSLILELLN